MCIRIIWRVWSHRSLGSLLLNVGVNGSDVGPNNLRLTLSRWYWCCWPKDHILRTTELKKPLPLPQPWVKLQSRLPWTWTWRQDSLDCKVCLGWGEKRMCFETFRRESMSRVVSIILSHLQINDSKVNRRKAICPKAEQELKTTWDPSLRPFHHQIPSPRVWGSKHLKPRSLTERVLIHSKLCLAFPQPSASS